MSITDELRVFAKRWLYTDYIHKDMLAIADRIDAEHQKAIRELNNLADASVLLPVDADGEYIHVGDEMCGYGWPNGGVYCRAIVNEVTILVGPQDGAYRGWLMWAANECRHHHAPAVEDVLTEFGIDWEHESDCEDRAALLKEYASKLRLAKEDA